MPKGTLLTGIRQSSAKDELALSGRQEKGSRYDSGTQCFLIKVFSESACDRCGYTICFKIQTFETSVRLIQMLNSLWHSYEVTLHHAELGTYDLPKQKGH